LKRTILGRRLARSLIAAVIIIAAAFFTRALWLPWVGEYLVRAGPPAKADIIVVLAGDFSGNRILKAADLVRQGYAAKALVSGPDGMYGHHESDLEIEMAESKGYPRSIFIPVMNHSRSTRDEARDVIGEMRKLGVRRFILVTSDTHTRRAGGVYRALAPDLQVTVVAAASSEFTVERWWREREGRKAVFMEWMKTVADWLGI